MFTAFPQFRFALSCCMLAIASCAMLLLPGSAAADPVPGSDIDWPMCGTGGDDDGRYCVQTLTKNGAAITNPGSGYYEQPYIDLIGSGTVRFGVYHERFDHGEALGDVPPTDTYAMTVNTGAIVPRELFGHIRNVSLSFGGSAATGHTFTLSFQPVPVAWLLGGCIVDACGDDTTRATTEYDGFVTGYVTDLVGSGLDATEIAQRVGFVHAYSAQHAMTPLYDPDTNSLIIRMANPHLTSAGSAPVAGTYETFLPNAMLTGLMNVPSPSSLTGGSFAVSRSTGGTPATVPFTLTHLAGGIRISITDITFSSPTYRIRPTRSAPGAVRLRWARRAGRTAVKLSFRAPLSIGGSPITKYTARCRRGSGPWRRASIKRGPTITVRKVARRKVTCAMRATNARGNGPWSPTRSA